MSGKQKNSKTLPPAITGTSVVESLMFRIGESGYINCRGINGQEGPLKLNSTSNVNSEVIADSRSPVVVTSLQLVMTMRSEVDVSYSAIIESNLPM